MTQSTTTPPTSIQLSLGAKLSLAAGPGAMAAAMAVMPAGADAAIVASAGLPLGPPVPTGTSNNWDVDGDGTPDFEFRNSSTEAYFDDLNGGRLVVPGAAGQAGIEKLASGFMVGATLAAGYKFHGAAQVSNQITSFSSIGSDAQAGGWSIGDTGFFGFKFTNASGTHYGWGELNIFGGVDGWGFSVLRAFYQDEADVAIQVGDEGSTPVAVPALPPPSLALLALALGAAGAPLLRRRRRAQ